jgi:type IV secretory pathway VirB6-like protein
MDCLLAVIFGYAGQTFLPLSLVSIATTAVWSGAAGGMLFFTVLGVFISLIFLVFRTVYVFLTAYLTVGFLVIISPMFIPLILIQSTEQFFNKWLENLIGAMLSPLMMFTFIGFALFLIDHVIFSGDNSLTAIIQDDIWEALKDEAPICNWQMQFDPEAMQQDATGVKSALAPFISGAMNLCSVIMFPSLDMGEEHNQRMWEIMIAVLKILAVVYVANQIMETLPNMMGQVFRAGGATVAGAVSGPVPGRQLVDQGVATVRSGAENFFSRALGR